MNWLPVLKSLYLFQCLEDYNPYNPELKHFFNLFFSMFFLEDKGVQLNA